MATIIIRALKKILPTYIPPVVFNPADNFAGGVAGAWWDPSDLSTLFQDTAGTIPVTTAGQSVALMKDKSGNGYDLLQSGVIGQPTLQKDSANNYYLSFDGANNVMQLSSANTLYVGTHSPVMLVAAKYNSTGTGALLVRSLFASEAGRYGLMRDQSGGGMQAFYQYNNTTNSVASVADSSTNTRVFGGIIDRPNGEVILTINTASYTSAFAHNETVNQTNSRRVLLCAYNDVTDSGQQGGYNLNGRIYGALLRMASTVDTDLFNKTRTWLGNKCGVTT